MRKAPAIAVNIRLVTLLAVAGGVLMLTACGGSSEPAGSGTLPTATASTPTDTTATDSTPTDTTPTDTAPSAGRTSVTVYFVNEDATGLVAQTRAVNDAGSPLRTALVALAAGKPPAGSIPALPTGTAIVGTDVRDGQAFVNLNDAFVTGYPSGGAAAEMAVLAPLVYTATEVEGVERVTITVDGQTPAPTGSQFDWSKPFTRADFPDLAVSAP